MAISGALANLRTMTTKKWRGPSGDELKAMWVLPKYLSKDMADAVESKGVATPKGPTAGEVIQAPTCPILVFINSRSGGRLGPELMEHFQELISPEQVSCLEAHFASTLLHGMLLKLNHIQYVPYVSGLRFSSTLAC